MPLRARQAQPLRQLACVLGATLTVTLVAGAQTPSPPRAPLGISPARLRALDGIVAEYGQRHGFERPEATVLREVIGQFSKLDPCPAEPKVPAVTDAECNRRARALADAAAAEALASPTDEELRRAAAEAVPTCNEGDRIKIRYALNPGRVVEVSGAYRGRDGNAIQVGSHRMLVQDLRPLGDEDDPALKFDPERAKAQRTKHIEARLATLGKRRKALADERFDHVLAEVRQRAVTANEANGHIRVDDTWLSIRQTATVKVRAAAEQWHRDHHKVAPPPSVPDNGTIPEDAAPETAEEIPPPVRGMTPGSTRKPPESRRPHGLFPALQNDLTQVLRTSAPAAPSLTTARPLLSAASPRRPALLWLSAVALCILSVIVLSRVFLDSWVEPTDSGGYFTDPASAQSGFWEKAHRNRTQFKYVAAQFPSRTEAEAALAGLSYVTMPGRGGPPATHRPIYAGVYPKDGQVTCFVGGPVLDYFMWREARDLLGRGANVRVSTPPQLDVHLPDHTTLGEAADGIKLVGQQEGEGHDYGYYLSYTAPDLARAATFLRHLPIPLPGIVATVNTPEGKCVKTWDGIQRKLVSEQSV